MRKIVLFFLLIILSANINAGWSDISIEPTNSKFPKKMSVGESFSVTYDINTGNLPIIKVNFPGEIISVDDNCTYSPNKIERCQITLRYTATYEDTGKHIEGTPSLTVGMDEIQSKNGHIDIKVVESEPSKLKWKFEPSWDNLIVGDSPINGIYTAENKGQQTAFVDYTELKPGDDEKCKIISDNCEESAVLNKNQNCTIEIRINPSEIDRIRESLEIGYHDYNPGYRTLSSTINTYVKPKGKLECKKAVNWQNVTIDDDKTTKTYEVINTGASDLEIYDTSFNSDQQLSLDNESCEKKTTLSPQEICKIRFVLDPKFEGEINRNLQIEHSGSNSPFSETITFSINPPPGQLVWEKIPSWNKAQINSNPVTETGVIRNRGGSPSTLTTMHINPENDQLRITGGTCSNDLILNPNITCNVDIELNPTLKGITKQDLELYYDRIKLLQAPIEIEVIGPEGWISWTWSSFFTQKILIPLAMFATIYPGKMAIKYTWDNCIRRKTKAD